MLHADELEEFRALQARAYGRGGALSAADAARLSELDARRTMVVVPAAVEVVAPEPVPEGPATDDGAPPAALASDSPAEDTSASRVRRGFLARWRQVAVIAVAALLLGIGGGYLLFGYDTAEQVELTAEQRGWQDDLLAEAVYDNGSLRPVAVHEGVVLWFATKSEGTLSCIVLGGGDSSKASCVPEDDARRDGLQANLSFDRDGDRGEVTAQVLLTPGGVPAASMYSYFYESGVTTVYANEEEEEFAATLVDEGYDEQSIFVVGYDGDNAVWTGMRPEEGTQCLIYAVGPVAAASRCEEKLTEGMWVEYIDPRTNEKTRADWNWDSARGANLVITRSVGVDDAAAG